MASLGPIERDAAIQRFEYSFEATWKLAQRVLRVVAGVEVGWPKAAIRAARESGMLSNDDAAALAMADDRNLTLHTYNEALARAIYSRLGGHHAVMERWVSALRATLAT